MTTAIGLNKLKEVDQALYDRLHKDSFFVDFFKALYLLTNMLDLGNDVEKIALFTLDHFVFDNDHKEKCAICCDDVKNGTKSISCKHVFCKECYNYWLRLNISCPECRTNPFIKPLNF